MPHRDNQDLILFLNKELSNFAVLYIKLHRYHWFIQGKMFFELHSKFQEWYEETAQVIDNFAERILAINGKPLATMAMYLKETSLREAAADDEPSEMLKVLYGNCEQICDEFKDGMKMCERLGDYVTADMLTGLQGSLEKRQWMLKSLLTDKSFESLPEPVRI